MCACSFSVMSYSLQPLFFVARSQTPLSLEFSRQEYWGGLSFSLPCDLPDPGIKPKSPVSCTGRWILFYCTTWEAPEGAFPSKGSTSIWGPEFIALELFVPESSISCPLLFRVFWKFARSSWLFFESLALSPAFSRLIFSMTWCSDVPHV